jgi:hypothetical protein
VCVYIYIYIYIYLIGPLTCNYLDPRASPAKKYAAPTPPHASNRLPTTPRLPHRRPPLQYTSCGVVAALDFRSSAPPPDPGRPRPAQHRGPRWPPTLVAVSRAKAAVAITPLRQWHRSPPTLLGAASVARHELVPSLISSPDLHPALHR